jgi:hypothetical protein
MIRSAAGKLCDWRNFYADVGGHVCRHAHDRIERRHAHIRHIRDVRYATTTCAGPNLRRAISDPVSRHDDGLFFAAHVSVAERIDGHRPDDRILDYDWRLESRRFFSNE